MPDPETPEEGRAVIGLQAEKNDLQFAVPGGLIGVRLSALEIAADAVWDAANFTGLVLGCIETKFCK